MILYNTSSNTPATVITQPKPVIKSSSSPTLRYATVLKFSQWFWYFRFPLWILKRFKETIHIPEHVIDLILQYRYSTAVRPRRSYVMRYGMALFLVLIAFFVRIALSPYIHDRPYLTFFGAVMGSAWYGGFGPGVMATVLATLGSLLSTPPPTVFTSFAIQQSVSAFVFSFEGVFISWLSEEFHLAMYRSKQSAAEIIKNQSRFQYLIEHSGDGITLLNRDGTFKYSSPSVKKILGYTPQELIGKPVIQFVHPDDQISVSDTLAKVIRNKSQIVRVEFRIRHKNGTYRWVEGTRSNMLDEPSVGAIVTNWRDITERKYLENEKDNFLAVASHELKTPLTTLKAYSQLLHASNTDRKVFPYLDKVDLQVDKLINLVNQLLDVTKIGATDLLIVRESFDIDVWIKKTVDDMRNISSSPIEIKGKVKYTLYGDEFRLTQVLINLINNAMKYSPKNKKIIIHVSKSNTDLTIRVQDFGIGIDKNAQKKIFERFYRISDNDGITGAKGLGLGLFIASEIVKRHHGKIWVDSTVGKGSTFWFSIPVR
jgi:PAS domain S-box-containing protein